MLDLLPLQQQDLKVDYYLLLLREMDEDKVSPFSSPNQVIFLCHERFPQAIWGYAECQAVIKYLKKLAQEHTMTIDVKPIVGCVVVRYPQQHTLVWLTIALLPMQRALRLPTKLLSDEAFPTLYTIHLNIPHTHSYTPNTLITTLCDQNPHFNCHLWHLLHRTVLPNLDHLILAIPKEYFNNFNHVENVIYFKSFQIIALFEFYEESCLEQPDSYAYLGKLNEMYSRYLSHLLEEGATAPDAQQVALTAFNNCKQLISELSSADYFTKRILDDLDFCEESHAAMSSDESVDILCDNYVIISKKEFPKSFLTYQYSDLLIKGIHFFLNCLPVKPQIGDFIFHFGWLRVSYGDENDLKSLQVLMNLVADSKTPLIFLPNDPLSHFHLISFSLPSCDSTDQQILDILLEENKNLDLSSWGLVERRLDEFQVGMNIQSFDSLKNNSFKFQYESTSYRANVLTGFVKNCPVSHNYTNIQREYLKYFNYLLDLQVGFDEADARCLKALENYNIMDLPDNRNSSFLLDRPIFFNVLFTQNIFETLQLFDDLMVSTHTPTLTNSYVILCNSDFPKTFLSSYFLHMLKKALVHFLNRLPIKPGIGNIVLDVGWLKIYYENEAALKTLVKIVKIINDERTALKLVRGNDIPEFRCTILESFPHIHENKHKILEHLKMKNSWLNMSGWCIAKREWDNLYITMDANSFRALQNNSFFLIYKSKAYITKPQSNCFLTKQDVDLQVTQNDVIHQASFHFEPIKLIIENNENTVELSTILSNLKKEQNSKVKRTNLLSFIKLKKKGKQESLLLSKFRNEKNGRVKHQIPVSCNKPRVFEPKKDANGKDWQGKEKALPSNPTTMANKRKSVFPVTGHLNNKKSRNYSKEPERKSLPTGAGKRGNKITSLPPPIANSHNSHNKSNELRKLPSIVRKVEPLRNNVTGGGKESRRRSRSRSRSQDKNRGNNVSDSIVNEYLNLIEELRNLSSLLKAKQLPLTN